MKQWKYVFVKVNVFLKICRKSSWIFQVEFYLVFLFPALNSMLQLIIPQMQIKKKIHSHLKSVICNKKSKFLEKANVKIFLLCERWICEFPHSYEILSTVNTRWLYCRDNSLLREEYIWKLTHFSIEAPRSHALCSQDQYSASVYSDSLFGEHFLSDHSILVCRLIELRRHA